MTYKNNESYRQIPLNSPSILPSEMQAKIHACSPFEQLRYYSFLETNLRRCWFSVWIATRWQVVYCCHDIFHLRFTSRYLPANNCSPTLSPPGLPAETYMLVGYIFMCQNVHVCLCVFVWVLFPKRDERHSKKLFWNINSQVCRLCFEKELLTYVYIRTYIINIKHVYLYY